jgi:hypothetical protein
MVVFMRKVEKPSSNITSGILALISNSLSHQASPPSGYALENLKHRRENTGHWQNADDTSCVSAAVSTHRGPAVALFT